MELAKNYNFLKLKSVIQLCHLHVGVRKMSATEEQIMFSKVTPLQAVVLRCEAPEYIQCLLSRLHN